MLNLDSTKVVINNAEILLDNEDWLLLKDFEHFVAVDGKYLMVRVDGVLKYAHRLILNAKDGEHVDHINNNSLDNRKSNLRIVSRSQNQMNRDKPISNKSTSKYKGVCYDITNRNWYCRVYLKGKAVYSGRFRDEISASFAYNHYASIYFGEFAKLNDMSGCTEIDWRANQITRKRIAK